MATAVKNIIAQAYRPGSHAHFRRATSFPGVDRHSMDGEMSGAGVVKMTAEKGRYVSNWSKTYHCTPELYFKPKTADDVIKIIQDARAASRKVRAIGCGFSPNEVFCTTDYMVDMRGLDRILQVDNENRRVTVQAGIVVGQLTEQLLEHGLMLTTMGALSTLTIGGAVSTATHGTGKDIYNMAGYVVELDIVDAHGTVTHCSRSHKPDVFLSALCGLGAVGIILNVTLQCETLTNLRMMSYEANFDDVLQNLDSHLLASKYFRFFWFPHTDGVVCQHIEEANEPRTASSGVLQQLGNKLYLYFLEFLLWIATFMPFIQPRINSFWLQGFGKPLVIVDRNDKILNINCYFKQYVNEWAVDRSHTAQVLKDLQAWLINTETYVHCPVEVRFSKGDDIYLSPCYGRDTCYINLVMYRPYGKEVERAAYWQAFDAIMKEAGGRPHWAKDHSQTVEDLKRMYPAEAWERFHRVRRSMDPDGMFMNSYLERVFGTS